MKKLLIVLTGLSLLTVSAFAAPKTICGENDDRDLSWNPKVARILKRGDIAGCTVTLIGKSCVVTAGHCKVTFEIAEFNTPASRNGRIVNSRPEDTYEVVQESVKFKNGGVGNDWAVLRLDKNSITGKYPGELQGHYEISSSFIPKQGDTVRITGYGRDAQDPIRNFAQQTHTGPVYEVDVAGSAMEHRADTMGGNSGSSVIHEETQQIIGIHTHGGCSRRDNSANASTLIASHSDFKAAIAQCLQWEEDNL